MAGEMNGEMTGEMNGEVAGMISAQTALHVLSSKVVVLKLWVMTPNQISCISDTCIKIHNIYIGGTNNNNNKKIHNMLCSLVESTGQAERLKSHS